MTAPLEYEHVIEKVCTIIAEVTGNELDDVVLTAHLEDDLGVDPVSDMAHIIGEINAQFSIQLDPEDVHTIETVKELALLIKDETILG